MLQRRLERARQRCRAATGDRGWQFDRPHDLRRSWGNLLSEKGVLPSIVKDFGGWEDRQTFRNHCLAEFSPEAIRRERKRSRSFPTTTTAGAMRGSGTTLYPPVTDANSACLALCICERILLTGVRSATGFGMVQTPVSCCSLDVGLSPNTHDVGRITNIQGWPRASTTSTRTTKRASSRT